MALLFLYTLDYIVSLPFTILCTCQLPTSPCERYELVTVTKQLRKQELQQKKAQLQMQLKSTKETTVVMKSQAESDVSAELALAAQRAQEAKDRLKVEAFRSEAHFAAQGAATAQEVRMLSSQLEVSDMRRFKDGEIDRNTRSALGMAQRSVDIQELPFRSPVIISEQGKVVYVSNNNVIPVAQAHKEPQTVSHPQTAQMARDEQLDLI